MLEFIDPNVHVSMKTLYWHKIPLITLSSMTKTIKSLISKNLSDVATKIEAM